MAAATSTATKRPLTRSEKDQLTTDLRLACMRISRRVRFESTAEVAPHQYSVLIRLDEQPRTPRELADIERVSPPSMTRTVNSLVELGLVQKAEHPTDGRQVVVTLTDAGKAEVVETRRRRDAWLTERLKGMTKEERQLLADAAELLRRIAAS